MRPIWKLETKHVFHLELHVGRPASCRRPCATDQRRPSSIVLALRQRPGTALGDDLSSTSSRTAGPEVDLASAAAARVGIETALRHAATQEHDLLEFAFVGIPCLTFARDVPFEFQKCMSIAMAISPLSCR